MIIQVRGTSGSGKSTIVRNILTLFQEMDAVKPVMRPGRKRPIAYRCKHPSGSPDVAIIGHYETKCGGCDTISIPGQSYPMIFELIKRNAAEGRNVLFEGLLISGDAKWSSQLASLDFKIIELDTPLEECLESINGRRKERLGDKYTPVNPINTESKHKLIQRCDEKLRTEFGIPVEVLSRKAAMDRVRDLLNV